MGIHSTNKYIVSNKIEYVDNTVIPLLYRKKDGGMSILLTDLEKHDSYFVSASVMQKILDNPGKPKTIQKARNKSQYGDAEPHKMLGYFPTHNVFKIYIGKAGKTIRKITDDIASNGELEMVIDLEALKILIQAIEVHDYARAVAEDREEKRTDYLEDDVILPEGQYSDSKTKKVDDSNE
jgi:hypothetical protein